MFSILNSGLRTGAVLYLISWELNSNSCPVSHAIFRTMVWQYRGCNRKKLLGVVLGASRRVHRCHGIGDESSLQGQPTNRSLFKKPFRTLYLEIKLILVGSTSLAVAGRNTMDAPRQAARLKRLWLTICSWWWLLLDLKGRDASLRYVRKTTRIDRALELSLSLLYPWPQRSSCMSCLPLKF